jgi:hypothetical protein
VLYFAPEFINRIKNIENNTNNIKTLWHVDPLLGIDCEISNNIRAVTRQRPVKRDRGKVFSVRFLPISYKQEKLVEWVGWAFSELEKC